MTSNHIDGDHSAYVNNIPVVDLSPFTSRGDHDSQVQAADDLRQALSVNGFIAISGHGISSDLLREAFQATKTLFDLSYEEKMRAPHPDGPVPHRGYSGPGRDNVAAKTAIETTDAEQKGMYSNTFDFKESFDMGSDGNKFEHNNWLPETIYPGFHTFALKLYWQLNATSVAILDALILGLKLEDFEADRVRQLHTGHHNQLRLLRYPPLPKSVMADRNVSRLGAHRDWSAFTLLFQDSNGGLEYLDRPSNAFVEAEPKDGLVYINVGNMLERISNGLYKSALHQVVDRNPHQARYSIPYFVSPTPDAVIRPLSSLVKKHGARKYEPVTSSEYSKKMFEAINVYK